MRAKSGNSSRQRESAEERLRQIREISGRGAKIARESDPPFSYTKFSYLESLKFHIAAKG